MVKGVETRSGPGFRLAAAGTFSQPCQYVGCIGFEARTETFGRELFGNGTRTGRGIEPVERRLGRIGLDLMLSQPGERRLGFGERAGEDRGALDAAPTRDPNGFCRSGDSPPALARRRAWQ